LCLSKIDGESTEVLVECEGISYSGVVEIELDAEVMMMSASRGQRR